MKVLIDACISFRIAYSLALIVDEDEIVALKDKFDPETKDKVWLPQLHKEGDWIVITADLGRKDGDRQVWLDSDLTIFFLAGAWTKGLNFVDMTQRFLKYWKSMRDTALKQRPGSKFDLSVNGKINKSKLK